MTTTDTGSALLRAVLADPHDDLPRLVYADWLGESGQPERAEFIRVQCQLTKVIAAGSRSPECSWGADWAPAYQKGRPCPTCYPGSGPLWEREKLLRGPASPGAYPANVWEWFARDIHAETFVTSRGFVSEVRLSLAAFLEHARGLFTRHPVERVVISDAEPLGPDFLPVPDWSWVLLREFMGDGPHFLPSELWERLDGFDTRLSPRVFSRRYITREAAVAALSRACVGHARSLAGLPPLPGRQPLGEPGQVAPAGPVE